MADPTPPTPELPLVHATARLCRCTAAAALALLGTAAGLARWNLGLWHTVELAPGLCTGQSLFGGGTGYARLVVDAERGTVDYAVGASPELLVPRIQARVQAAGPLGYGRAGDEGAPMCIVTLLAWRTADMDTARWQRLVHSHEVEIELIRSLLDADAAQAKGAA